MTDQDQKHDDASRDAGWRAELIRLGGSIHQDDGPELTEEEYEAEQAGIARYYEMLDGLEGDEAALRSAMVAEAVIHSLHPIADYGIYEAAYNALRQFDPETLGHAAARALPAWLEQHGDYGNIDIALAPIAWGEEARAAFTEEATAWADAVRTLVLGAMRRWVRDDEEWEPVFVALGGIAHWSSLDPIPDDWPDEWRAAAQGFRESGRVDLAWPNERDLSANFDLVLALLGLSHGPRWRETGHLLNILFVRRRDGIAPFARSLAALPAARRDTILAALDRAAPERATLLRSMMQEEPA